MPKAIKPPSTARQAEQGQDLRYASLKNLTMLLYVLYLAAIVTAGLLAIVALIINYIKRKDVQGSILESHFNWQIRTFWWFLFGNMIAFIPLTLLFFTQQDDPAYVATMMSTFGFTLMVVILAWFWVLYRIVRGLLALSDNKPVD